MLSVHEWVHVGVGFKVQGKVNKMKEVRAQMLAMHLHMQAVQQEGGACLCNTGELWCIPTAAEHMRHRGCM